ncbi:helix-turn-helix transcriptional regulator [uncultured Gemmiger sp.]|uniref:helix-turn-helix transcriptional regulator n=1 Tax=uncultured Gemmiger sp. TaxID=1623490 RepID=UPI0025E09ACB|nr:helix-turn-helix transcriptional regulator [uncultured Gemmiger sp.]
MNIGQKLKQARAKACLTQEQAAEALGVARQTVSNWENSRSYPDVVAVLAMSDLYHVSLDELLKGDRKMIDHLEQSTDTVASRGRLARRITVLAYLVVWALVILVFWLGGRQDALGYSLVNLYLVLPVTTLAVSVVMGLDEGWRGVRWLMLLLLGLLYMLVPYATFSLANMASFGQLRLPEAAAMLPGILCAAAGMGIGCLVRRLKWKRAAKQ